MARIGVVTIRVFATGRTLIPIGPRYAIGCVYTAPRVCPKLTGLALSFGTEWLIRVITIPRALTLPTEIPIGTLHTNGVLRIAALIREALARTTCAVITHRLIGIGTVRIVCTFRTFTPGTAISAEGRIIPTAHIPLDEACLALTVVTLALVRVVTVPMV